MEASERTFLDQQNRFRGVVSEFKSRRFVEKRAVPPSRRFRTDIKEVLLDARAALSSEQYGPYLRWVHQQVESQLPELSRTPIGYDELSGVYAADPVPLERELHWVAERLALEVPRLRLFRTTVMIVERLIAQNQIENALEALEILEKAFGVSIWSVQLRIALEQFSGGLERQKRYSAEVRGIYRRGLLGFVAYHTSVRNEDKSTPIKFTEQIRARIERHSLYSDDVKTYLRYRLMGEWGQESDQIARVLRVEQSHNLLDLFETFVSTAQELIRRPELQLERMALREHLGLIPTDIDFRLAKVARMLGNTIGTRDLPHRRRDISDALISGRWIAAANAFRSARHGRILDVWDLVYGGFAFAGAARGVLPRVVRSSDAVRLLSVSLRPGEEAAEARLQLEKFAVNLKGVPFAAGIAEFLDQTKRVRSNDPWQPWLIGLHSPTLGVEDESAGAQQLVEAGGSTVAAWRRVSGSGAAGPLRAVDALFEGAGLILACHYNEAAAVLRSARTADRILPLQSLATNLLLHALWGGGDRPGCIELLADCATQRPSQSGLLPIAATLEGLAWVDFRDAIGPFSAPIALHLLWAATEREITLSQLRFATGSALRACGVARPSELLVDASRYPRHQLVYFLAEVCEPAVLDLLRSIKSTRSVLEERQAIATALRSLDPNHASKHADEMMIISGELTMAEGQWIVDHSRIHVDASALGRWAFRELSEDFSRFQDLLAVDVGPQENFDDVLRELTSRDGFGQQNFETENEADAVLVSMMRRLEDEFLANPAFGLDFYLSKRIRHQSFIGRIRGPLEFANLITTREKEGGSYHRNEHWLQQFKQSSPDQIEAINSILESCAADFDEILREAKDRYFQLRSSEHPDGLLRLELTPQIIRLIKSIARLEPENFGAFYVVAVAVLWAALEPALSEVRRFISQDLKTRVTERFERTRAEVRTAAGQDPAFYPFDIEFGLRSTEVQRALDDAAGWFTHTDVETYKRTFTLQEAVTIGLDNALKCHRGFDPKVTHDIEGNINVASPTLVSIHDTIFVALDNARAHSGHKAPNVEILVRHNEESETLTLEVLSDCRPHQRAHSEKQLEDIRRLMDGGTPIRRTRREGGSGLLKLSVVAKQSSKGMLDFGFTDEGRFRLVVTYAFSVQPAQQPVAA